MKKKNIPNQDTNFWTGDPPDQDTNLEVNLKIDNLH